MVILSANINCDIMAYRSFQPEEYTVRGAEKLPQL